jgi:CheY-like chemotaxis protein
MKPTKPLRTATLHARSTNRPRPLTRGRENPACHSPEGFPPGKRILLVDDDPTVRDSLQHLLTAEGFSVTPVENGQQALDRVNKSSFDLVMLDLNMPVKNGWDTFERLSAEHPLLPIIIATARPNQLFMALNAGVGALLEKPLDIPILLRTIEKLLVEPADQRLARLAGKKAEFHYQPTTAQGQWQHLRRPAGHH